LAGSRRRGGISDLLRDGHKIPGSRGHPPSNAQYDTTDLVSRVDALYAWYRTRPASTKGWKSLARLENDLSFSRLTG
jgi:hypothetical protein